MGYSFNSNVLVTNLPPIPQALVWTKNYDGKETLLNLSQGSPGVPPPHEFLSRIAESVMEPDSTKYGDVRGEMGLREAISKDMREYYCCGQIKFENISIAAGCNMAFLTTVMVLAAPGDELIVPEPFYFNHEMTLKTLGVVQVPLLTMSPSFLPSVSQFKSLITSRTKALVLVTPDNPTGVVYSPGLIQEFFDICREKYSIFQRSDKAGFDIRVRPLQELLGNSNWNIITSGSYYAYVKHPYAGRSSAWVAERLAKQAGVILLPGSFFCNPATVDEDCYLRVSVANVSVEILRLIPERLERFGIWYESQYD